MKTLLLALSFSIAAHATGGNGSGGGFVEKSTRADLEEVVANLPEQIWESSDRYMTGGMILMTTQPMPPKLARLSKAILGSDGFSINEQTTDYVKALKFNIVDGVCTDSGHDSDASTAYQKNATICLSAENLARYPKSELKTVLLPLIFHEIAHQFGFTSEDDANMFESLVSLHLKYREIFYSAWRAQLSCAVVTKTPLTPDERKSAQDGMGGKWPRHVTQLNAFYCAARSNSVGENLERIFNGSEATTIESGLTPREESFVKGYGRQASYNFLAMTRALTEPTYSSYDECTECQAAKVDNAYLMMLGAKSAIHYIDTEISRVENLIAK